MEESTLRRREAQDLLDLAQSYLEAAQALRNREGHIRGAIDLAYNAAELSAKGMLLLREGGWPKTHSGIIQPFRRAFILEDKTVDAAIGRALRQSLDTRNRARYDPHATLRSEDADGLLSLAATLASILQQQLL